MGGGEERKWLGAREGAYHKSEPKARVKRADRGLSWSGGDEWMGQVAEQAARGGRERVRRRKSLETCREVSRKRRGRGRREDPQTVREKGWREQAEEEGREEAGRGERRKGE